MASLLYHQQAIALAKSTPQYDLNARQQIDHIADTHNIVLPQALAEWLCLDPESTLFNKLTHFPHEFVTVRGLQNHISHQQFTNHVVQAIEIIFENQGCFVMAVSLEDGDDPPVWVFSDFYFCRDSKRPTWQLHSHSFTDCIKAFAWDFNVCDQPDGVRHFRGIEQVPTQHSDTQTGPTTYVQSAWFLAHEFRRLEIDNVRFTLLLDNNDEEQ